MRSFVALCCIASLAACAGGSPESGVPPVTQTLESNQSSAANTEQLASFTPTNWDVAAGASHDFYAEQDLDYYPDAITIDAGDSITYRIASGAGGDAHTVSFVPAGQKIPSPGDPNDLVPAGGTTIDGSKFVNSGLLLGGQLFTLHFPKPGTYAILCLFHEPAMESTVIVQKAGTPYPHTAAYYEHVGAVDEWVDLNAAAASVALFPFPAYGTTLAAGISPNLDHGPPSQSTVLRFLTSGALSKLPAEGSLTVKVGTVLTWVNQSNNEPHTITFALAGQNRVPNIPPDPPMNVVPPPAVTDIDGSKIVNSGSIFGGQKFMARFTKPGTYFYGCVYHANSRMTGAITVVQ